MEKSDLNDLNSWTTNSCHEQWWLGSSQHEWGLSLIDTFGQRFRHKGYWRAEKKKKDCDHLLSRLASTCRILLIWPKGRGICTLSEMWRVSDSHLHNTHQHSSCHPGFIGGNQRSGNRFMEMFDQNRLLFRIFF